MFQYRLLFSISARGLFLIALGLAVAGCASARKRFEQGTQLEAEGRYLEASRRYIQSLSKEPDQPEVRLRLQEAGEVAVARLLDDAAQASSRERAVEAADLLLELDDFVAHASRVGVQFELPETYPERRSSAMEDAVSEWMQRGLDAERRRRWDDAVRSYDSVMGYEPSDEAADEAAGSAIAALLDWSRSDLQDRRYVSALERADEALHRMGGPDVRGAEVALALRAEAIDRGTLFVAFTEVRPSPDVRGLARGGFLDEVNDVLDIEFWTRPPVMVAAIDPLEVRREVRREGPRRGTLTSRDAARIGRRLDADYALTAVVERFDFEERDIRERVRSARVRRGGGDTTYVEISGRLRIEVEVDLELVDVLSRRVVERSTVRASESGRFERAVYAGDFRTLDLSRAERALFDADRLREQEIEIENELIEDLAEKVAEAAFDDIRRRLR